MIEFHESEYSTALSDRSMRLVALLLGPECATRLIYCGDKYARLYGLDPARNRPDDQKWTHHNDDSGPFDIWNTPDDQESEAAAPSKEIPALDRVG